jgi:dihydrodipicolinate synthase/N-acetylneuraminate lyase
MLNMFKLQGVVPPMITPFNREGDVDVDNLERLVDYLKARVNGLYICGSYGSGPLMNVEERKVVAEVCVRTSQGKIPIIAHVGTTNTRDTVELTKHAESIGCAGVAAVGPYYFHHGRDGVMAFYEAMLDAVSPGYPSTCTTIPNSLDMKFHWMSSSVSKIRGYTVSRMPPST